MVGGDGVSGLGGGRSGALVGAVDGLRWWGATAVVDPVGAAGGAAVLGVTAEGSDGRGHR